MHEGARLGTFTSQRELSAAISACQIPDIYFYTTAGKLNGSTTWQDTSTMYWASSDDSPDFLRSPDRQWRYGPDTDKGLCVLLRWDGLLERSVGGGGAILCMIDAPSPPTVVLSLRSSWKLTPPPST